MENIFFTGERHKKKFTEQLERYPHEEDNYKFVAALYICCEIYASGYISVEGIDLERAEKGHFPKAHMFLLRIAKSLFGDSELVDLSGIDDCCIDDTLVFAEAIKIASMGLNYKNSIDLKARMDAYFEARETYAE